MLRTSGKHKRLRRGGKNTQKHYTRKVLMTQITTMVWSLIEPDILKSWTHAELWILNCEVKWVLGNITTNKASRGNGIPVALFQILKDDAVKVLHSIYQNIWKTQQWPQDWKMLVFIPIPKKANAKHYLNHCEIVLASHASKVMHNIFQAWIQHHTNQ